MNKKLFLLIPFVFALSCKPHTNSTEAVVYSNDFENNDLSKFENGITSQYNGSTVLGQYNNQANKGYFKLTLNNLPKHDLVTVSFDLFIHDSWDGNKAAPDGPDIWQMLVDGNSFINTTFSNESFKPGYFASPQSYPFNYPNNYNNPKVGAYRTDLPGICGLVGPNGTSEYKITKTFTHTNSTLVLQCLDKLVQTNVSDPKCDESWSVDNIVIKAITL
jgi:hypothetical protein